MPAKVRAVPDSALALGALPRPLLLALALAQLAYPRVPSRLQPAATRAVVGLMLTASGTEAARACGTARAARLLGSAGAVGLAAELAGTATGLPFGRYSYSERLGPRWRGVPLLAAGAWAMMSRPAWVVGDLLARRARTRVALSAAALAAWDVFLDPRMVRDGYWRWEAGGRYEGVPASNFAGWLVTGAVLFSLWEGLERGGRAPMRESEAAEGDGALALYLWTWVGETFANALVWRRARVAAAGGTAMGALALPALAARLRRGRRGQAAR